MNISVTAAPTSTMAISSTRPMLPPPRIVPLRSTAARVLASVDWMSAMMVVATLAHAAASRRRIISRLTYSPLARKMWPCQREFVCRDGRRDVGGHVAARVHHARIRNHEHRAGSDPITVPPGIIVPDRPYDHTDPPLQAAADQRSGQGNLRYFDTPQELYLDQGSRPAGVPGHLPLNRRLPREILGTWTGGPGGLSFLILR